MKEATGELNSSVIVFTAVALLAAFFFMVIWPNIKGGFQHRSTCANAVCDSGVNGNNMVYCKNPDNKNAGIFECPYKG